MFLNMEPNEIRTAATKLSIEAKAQMSSYTLIKARIVQLENGWHGDAQKALRQKYEEQEPILKRHTDQLNQFAQLLQKTANEMEQMDLDLTRFFQQY